MINACPWHFIKTPVHTHLCNMYTLFYLQKKSELLYLRRFQYGTQLAKMSIQFTFDSGWIVDHLCFIDDSYKNTIVTSKMSPSDTSACSTSSDQHSDPTHTDLICDGPFRQSVIVRKGSRTEAICRSTFLCKRDLFAIFEPFMMDSQFIKLKKSISCTEDVKNCEEKAVEDIDLPCSEGLVETDPSHTNKSCVSSAVAHCNSSKVQHLVLIIGFCYVTFHYI